MTVNPSETDKDIARAAKHDADDDTAEIERVRTYINFTISLMRCEARMMSTTHGSRTISALADSLESAVRDLPDEIEPDNIG